MSQNNLGSQILELHKAKRWPQTGLANKIDISYTQIQQYETKGGALPKVIKKIPEALDTSIDYLLNGSTAEESSTALHNAEVIDILKRWRHYR